MQGEFRRADGGETLTGVLPQMPTVTGTYKAPVGDYGGSILGRLTHTFLNGSDVSLQASFEKSQVFGNEAHDWSKVANIDFQHHLHLGSRNDLVWGLSYRVAFNRFAGRSVHSGALRLPNARRYRPHLLTLRCASSASGSVRGLARRLPSRPCRRLLR